MRPGVQRIISDLANPDEDICTYAAMSVLRLQKVTQDEVEALLPALRKGTTHESISVRFFSRKSLNEIKLQIHKFPALTAELDRIKQETQRTSWRDLLSELAGESIKRKLVVLDLLKDIDDPRIVPAIIDYLSLEADPFVLAECVRIMGFSGTTEHLEVLKPYLEHQDSRIRSNAVEAIEEIGGKEVVESIVPLLRDDDNRVKATVAKILSKYGEVNVLATLAEMIRSVEIWMRESAIYALGFVPFEEAVDLLIEALLDVNTEVRMKALESLERLSPRRAEGYLHAMVGTGDPNVSAAAQRVLNKIAGSPKDYQYFVSPGSGPQAVPDAPLRRGKSSGQFSTIPAKARGDETPSPTSEDLSTENESGISQITKIFKRGHSHSDQQELDELVAARNEMLVEIGELFYRLFEEGQLQEERPYMSYFHNEVKKLRYLIAQKEAQMSDLAEESRTVTFMRFIKESVSRFTQEKQVDGRLKSLKDRLKDRYQELGRKIVDDFSPNDIDLLRLKDMPRSVQKLDRQIEGLMGAIPE